MTYFIPGQGSSLHDWNSSLRSLQSSPPLAGGGLVQDRNLFFVPLPQEAEHTLQTPHDVSPPGTARVQKYKTDKRFIGDERQIKSSRSIHTGA